MGVINTRNVELEFNAKSGLARLLFNLINFSYFLITEIFQ